MRQEILEKLTQVVGSEYCQSDVAIRRQHGYSETAMPDVVVFPETSEQVAQVVKTAFDEGIPVVPWGAGTMAFRGLLPLNGGIAINLTRMNKIIEYDYENMTAYVEAGITLKELQKELKTHNLYWQVEPLEPDTCTVGGCVAAGASGPSKLGYGDVKFHLLGLEVVTPTGDIINPGAKTVKNVQDLDNTRFITGSWGSIGIITKAMLKLKPVPEKATSIFISFKDMKEAIEASCSIRNETLPVSLELLDETSMKVMTEGGFKPNGNGTGVLVKFEGFIEQVDVMVEYVKKQYSSTAVLGEEEAKTAWQARAQLFSNFAGQKGAVIVSAAMPFTEQEKFLLKVKEELSMSSKKSAIISHFGNAHVHIFIDQAPEAYDGIKELVNRLVSLATGVNGVLVVDNVTDMTLARRWVESRGKAILDIMSRFKSTIDPRQIMTPNSKVLSYVVSGTRAVS